MSWYDSGMPVINDPDVLATAELIRRLYEDWHQYAGGPLHVILEDGNTEDEQVHDSDYFGLREGYTVETYLCRHRWQPPMGHVYDDELAWPGEVADLCRLILASFRRMPEPWRAAAIAWYNGTAWEHLERLAGEPLVGGPPAATPQQVDDFVADLRRWIEQGEQSGPKACISIPCPPFTYDADPDAPPRVVEVGAPIREYYESRAPRAVEGGFSGVIHPGPGMRFAPDAKIVGPFESYSINDDGSATITAPIADVDPSLAGGTARYEQTLDTPSIRVTKLDAVGQPIGEPVEVSRWAAVGIQADEPDPEHPEPTLKWVEATTGPLPLQGDFRDLYELIAGVALPQVNMDEVLNQPPQVHVPKIVRVPRGMTNEQAHKLLAGMLRDGLLKPSEAGWQYLPEEVTW